MNHPAGFALVDGRATTSTRAGTVRQPDVLERVRPHDLRRLHRLRVPAGRGLRVVDPAGAARPLRADRASASPVRRLSRGAAAGDRGRLGGPRRGHLPAGQAGRDGGPATTTRGAAEHLLGWYNGHAVVWGVEIPGRCPCWPSTARTRSISGLDIVPLADQPPVNVVRFAFQTMVGIGTLLGLIGLVYLYLRSSDAAAPAPLAAVGGSGGRAAVGGRADRRVDHHRGRPGAAGIVYEVMRVAARRSPGPATSRSGTGPCCGHLVLAVIVFFILRQLARIPLPENLVTVACNGTAGE